MIVHIKSVYSSIQGGDFPPWCFDRLKWASVREGIKMPGSAKLWRRRCGENRKPRCSPEAFVRSLPWAQVSDWWPFLPDWKVSLKWVPVLLPCSLLYQRHSCITLVPGKSSLQYPEAEWKQISAGLSIYFCFFLFEYLNFNGLLKT